ncbi:MULTISPECIES: LysR substrate-binding domain-containing protein [Brevibacterium]|uniref:LysR family transcriptional regulator n=1 Tax=Brevibacterium salitolerans TaxID=1403566 RepID=A0ABP5I373_9MICO|nr:LysR substrate-binding domain-containing protein [Brevibacterium sp.]
MPLPVHELPDTRVLVLLVHLLRAGRDGEMSSIGEAARAVGLAQPHASRALRSFEAESGLRLLVRTPRGTVLTEQGRAVAAWAEPVVDGLVRVRDGLTALRRERAVEVSVSASLTVAEFLLPVWLERFRAARPGARVALEVANSLEVARAVRASRVELGLIESPGAPEGVESQVIGEDELIVAVSPGHPWARRRAPVGAAELAATPLLVREPGSGTRDAVDRALAGWGGPAIAAEHSSNAAIRVAARAGIAPCALSRLALHEAVHSGALVEVAHAPEVRLTRPLRALWPAGTRPRGAAAELLDLVRQR